MVTDTGQAAQPLCLIHVGPHKTGTTTVQAAFHGNRSALHQAGVLYLGDQLQPTIAVKALTGAARGAVRDRGLLQWEELVRQAGTTRGTVVLSSEFLCEADVPVARRVVEELARTAQRQAQVVVTLRSLAKILPSQWQQFVQSGTEAALDEWLEWALENYDADPLPPVWQRHRHHDVVSRWAQAVGPENVTVVVADDSRPQWLPQVFETLLDLPGDTLVPPVPVANRSLTLEEAEAVRLFNQSYRRLLSRRRGAGKGPSVPDLTMDQRMAVWRSLKRTTPDQSYQKVALPASVSERVTALAHEMVLAIEALGVRVIGDLGALTAPQESLPDDALRVRDVRPQLAADVATALLTQVMRKAESPETDAVPPPVQSARVSRGARRRLPMLERAARRLSRARAS